MLNGHGAWGMEHGAWGMDLAMENPSSERQTRGDGDKGKKTERPGVTERRRD